MVFSSYVFVLLFLPVFLGIYYLIPFRFRSGWILIASYAFYAWWRVDFVILIFLTTLWTYLFGAKVAETVELNKRRAKFILLIGVAGNLGVLAYFKYFNFGVDSLNEVLLLLDVRPLSAWNVILPVGISFYVFQATSYLIDVYRGDASKARSFWDLSAFVALFPQLIAGPILRYKDLEHQFQRRTHTLSKFSEGAVRFMIGFCKKVLIADAVAPIADAAFAYSEPTMVDAWMGALAYTVQLYFDFSGYSDMAIGLGLMMGFRFRENFDHPYISRSITEFWRRWHISLSNWLRDYLYFSLGGNRRGIRRTYVNLMLVMLLGGLWHGANWTFVLWGGWHGAWLAAERYFAGSHRSLGDERPAFMAKTLLIVILGWVMFRAESVTAAVKMYAGLIGLNGLYLSDGLAWQIQGFQVSVLIMGLALVVLAPAWYERPKTVPAVYFHPTSRAGILILPCFVFALLRLSAQSYSPFLYFQF